MQDPALLASRLATLSACHEALSNPNVHGAFTQTLDLLIGGITDGVVNCDPHDAIVFAGLQGFRRGLIACRDLRDWCAGEIGKIQAILQPPEDPNADLDPVFGDDAVEGDNA